MSGKGLSVYGKPENNIILIFNIIIIGICYIEYHFLSVAIQTENLLVLMYHVKIRCSQWQTEPWRPSDQGSSVLQSSTWRLSQTSVFVPSTSGAGGPPRRWPRWSCACRGPSPRPRTGGGGPWWCTGTQRLHTSLPPTTFLCKSQDGWFYSTSVFVLHP